MSRKKWWDAYNNASILRISDKDNKLNKSRDKIAKLPGGFEKAIKSAMRRVSDGLKTDAVNETKKRYHLKSGEIRRELLLKKGISNLDRYHSTILIARGYRRQIMDYKVAGKGNDITVAVRTDGMKKLRTGYLLVKDNGEKVVMWKPPVNTGHAKAVISPSVPQAIQNQETRKIIIEKAGERFEKRLDHEINRLMGAFK